MKYDKELLLGLKHGDKECFRQLFEEHYDVYFTFARGMIKDQVAAEDIVQDMFMKLWVRREHIDVDRSVHHFLLTIIKNAIYNHMRLRYNARKSDVPLPDVEDVTSHVDEEYMQKELSTRIDSIVEQMPTRRRLIFTMSRKEHLTNSEIAGRLSISQRTVEKHIEEALRELSKLTNISILVFIMKLF